VRVDGSAVVQQQACSRHIVHDRGGMQRRAEIAMLGYVGACRQQPLHCGSVTREDGALEVLRGVRAGQRQQRRGGVCR
jgi:hypothetical protein